ncbi:uncharacterized protein BDZ99DRAFT_469266 [Mytilinidion resinicola]|uniref:Uncharacterized protein n=1 Tax=Mytilinidion resinicola TaxID=574789 RepID=A0A6A6XZN4_9PEZI|nr:uncharacterized protein BDZ99DRAFT_469266 [Mytilinidion resinicola]KAF2801982.1 hypothetical protein BDZ99DRAFT_469266 [Mytilinidion resinicola]
MLPAGPDIYPFLFPVLKADLLSSRSCHNLSHTTVPNFSPSSVRKPSTYAAHSSQTLTDAMGTPTALSKFTQGTNPKSTQPHFYQALTFDARYPLH